MVAAARAAELAAVNREAALVDDPRDVRTILEWIGFNTALERERISDESFQDYIDI